MTKDDNINYERALEQTVSDEHFNSGSIRELAETLCDEDYIKAEHNKTVEDILLDTIAEADPIEHSSGETAQLTERTFSYKEDAEQSLNDKHVEGRYRIVGDLGTGATGHVFSVHDNNFNRDIAVKFLHPKYAGDQKRMLQFLNEARITAKLTHPNILPIHDIDFTEGALIYFTMGKADGYALADLLRDEKLKANPASPIHNFNDRVRIIQQVCHAISYAHGQGIIHKDIKPSNIMVGTFGEVLVVDWGTASYDNEENNKKSLVGTPIYMSPEQARKECADQLSDIYCIGSTFFHMLTLEYPCLADDLDTFWELKRQGKHNDISAAQRKIIPKALYTIALKAMAADRKQRYQHVDEIIQDLEAYQHGRSTSAYTESLGEIALRLIKHNKLVSMLTLIALILIGTASLWLYNEKVHIYRSWETVYSASTAPAASQHTAWTLTDDAGTAVPASTNSPITEHHHSTLTIAHAPDATPKMNISYHAAIADLMQISWKHQPMDEQQALHFFIAGKTSTQAYTFKIMPQQSQHLLSFYKQGQLFSQSSISAHKLGSTPSIRISKQHSQLSLFINNTAVFTYHDPEILIGPQHQSFGFVCDQNSGATIHDLVIKKQKNPNKYAPIVVANNYYSNQLYDHALILYKNIRKNYPQSHMSSRALYLKGRSLSQLAANTEACVSYQQCIQLYPNDNFVEHAKVHYILALAKTSKWALCLDAYNRYMTSISAHKLQLQVLLPLDKLLKHLPEHGNSSTQDVLRGLVEQQLNGAIQH